MKAFVSLVLSAIVSGLVSMVRGLVSGRQARADEISLGAARAEAATDKVIDGMEADQDAVDKVDRGGAAGVLARLRATGDGTAGANR